MRVWHTALIGCLMVWAVRGTASAACNGCSEDDKLCGPRCLLSVCQRTGVAATLHELEFLSGYDGRSGTALLGLQHAAETKGLQAVAMKVGVGDLVEARCPRIAHLWGSHFVVVEAGDAGTLRLTDPPEEPKLVKKEDFAKLYSGFALLIAKDASVFPEPKAEGPDLRLDTYTWDFGAVNQDILVERVVKLRNVGNADLVISKVETSCGDCLVPIGGPQTIAPGGEGEMKAMVVTANQRRGVSKELLIHSNDPISPVVHLAVTGYVRPSQLAFSPRSVYLGSPRRTEKASSEVYIPSFEEDKVEVSSVSSSSPYLTT